MRLPLAAGVSLLALALAAPAGAALGLKRVAGGFSTPIQVALPTRGAMYVAEQGGRVVRVGDGRRRVLLDLSGAVSTGGERGLLAEAFHPNWRVNRLFYVYYTNRSGTSVVARYRTNARGTRIVRGSRKVLLRVGQPASNHNGGTLAFGADGRLYLSLGDGGGSCDPNERAQDLGSRLGKILRRAGGRWRIVAYGLRNPWRFSFDRRTGAMYIGDVGQATREEINFVRAADVASRPRENYGWDKREGTAVDTCENEGLKGNGVLVDPIHEYGRAVGFTVIGGYVYRGRKLPGQRGRYFFGDLSGKVFSIDRATGANHRLHGFTVSSLVSFGETARGELLLVSRGGTVYRLVRR